ncbi:TPT1 [Mytilus edulis]|uniref:2'-phosphotransferase n=1 Tax=Mytilus edulis TaxID=6550 RepID=A0A8S3VHC9_MYTED|nr:TPT1 [Mytilus edulis]
MEEGSLGGNVGSDSTSTGSEGAGIAPRQADRHLSKTLAYTLRHGAQKYNYDVQSDGYLFVDEILSCQPGLKGYSDEDICRVVRFDDNKRFRLSTDDITGRLKIKANHGHSIPIHDSDLVLIKQGEVTKAYHCTSMVGWDGIVGMGINKMGRVHIHFSTQVPDSLKPHWEVIVQVNIKEAQQDGNEEGTLPAKYISFAQHLDSGEYMNLDPSVSLHDDDESIEAEHSDLICEIGSSCNSVNEVMCPSGYPTGFTADPGKHFFDSTCKSTEWGKVGPNTEQSGNWSDSTGDGVSEIENDPPPGYREATREPGDETSGSDLDNTLVKGMQDSKVMRVSCNLSNELSGYVVEACTHDELLVPRTLQAPGRHPIICLMNISDKHVTIPENEMIARAIEVEILPGTELGLAQGNGPWVCKVDGEDHSLVEEGVSNHLKICSTSQKPI